MTEIILFVAILVLVHIYILQQYQSDKLIMQFFLNLDMTITLLISYIGEIFM